MVPTACRRVAPTVRMQQCVIVMMVIVLKAASLATSLLTVFQVFLNGHDFILI